MQPLNLPLSRKVVPLVLLCLTALLTPPGQAQPVFHGAAIYKTPVGPDGTARAQIGETITASITVQNMDEFNDSLRLTTIYDIEHHFSGDVTSPNLLTPGRTVMFFRDFVMSVEVLTTNEVTLTNQFDSVTLTHTYTVMAGDDQFADRLLKDDAVCEGIDNRDGPLTFPRFPDNFLLTFPGQVFIYSPTNETNFCVIRAVSDPFYNPGGSDHAVWLPGISTNLIFWPEPGIFTTNANGTARLTGKAVSLTNINAGFLVDVSFSGYTDTPPPGSPKLDLDPDAYIGNGGPIDPFTWVYYTSFSGTLTGCGLYEGGVLEITRFGPAFQVGRGANGKNLNFGASGWFTWNVTSQPTNGIVFPATGIGDFNVDIIICEPSLVQCVARAFSHPTYNPNGSDHAVWLQNFVTNLVFTPEPGLWVENLDGTARLKGTARSLTNLSSGFEVDVILAGYSLSPPSGSPKKDLDSDAYINNGGPINPATWRYYTHFTGTLRGFGHYEGALLAIKRTGPAFQIGFGANNKNINYGASAWFTWRVVQQPLVGSIPVTGTGDFNVDIFDCLPTGFGDLVFNDGNNNGIRDGGEPGVPGVEVRLTDCLAQVLATATTDAAGAYYFTNLVPGSYKIRVLPPAGASVSPQNAGGDDTIDSDFNASGYTPCLSVAYAEVNDTVDAGLLNVPIPTPILPRLLSYQHVSVSEARLRILGETGRLYQIEGSSDLTTWRFITVAENNNGVLDFSDLDRGSRCFYRVVQLP